MKIIFFFKYNIAFVIRS